MDPNPSRRLAKELGSYVDRLTLQDAVKADVVILAVPFRCTHGGRPRGCALVRQDRGRRHEHLRRPAGGTEWPASTVMVASAFPGAKLVKTLNQLPAKLLAKDPAEGGGRRVMFVSSNDQGAEASIAKLVDQLGFAPCRSGKSTKAAL